MNRLSVSLFLLLCSCGGSGSGDDADTVVVQAAPTPTPTPIEVTHQECGDLNVEQPDLEPVFEEAADESIPINEIVSEPDVPQCVAGLQQCTRTLKVILINASCSTVVVGGDTVEDNDNVILNPSQAQAEKILAAMRAGLVERIEVR